MYPGTDGCRRNRNMSTERLTKRYIWMKPLEATMCQCATSFYDLIAVAVSVIIAAPIGAFLGVKIVDWIDNA